MGKLILCIFVPIVLVSELSAATVYDFSNGAVDSGSQSTKEEDHEGDGDSLSDSDLIAMAKKYVNGTLAYGGKGAIYGDFQVQGGSHSKVVCGSVNPLNLSGEYLGYRSFAFSLDDLVLVHPNSGVEISEDERKYKRMGCP